MINGEVHLKPCKSSDKLDDIFTKSLAKDVFEFHRINLGVVTLAKTWTNRNSWIVMIHVSLVVVVKGDH